MPVIVIIGMFLIISLFKIISYRLKVNKIEKKLLSYCNLEPVDGIKKGKGIEYLTNDSPAEYDITKIVDYYLLQLKSIKEGKVSEKDTNNQLYINDNNYYTQYSKDYTGYVASDNIDVDFAKSELEKIFIHKDKNWFISVNANEKYDLPYEYYITYEKRQFEKLDNVKKVLSVRFTEKIDFKLNETNTNSYNVEIIYLDKNNKKQKNERYATYHHDTKLWGVGLNQLYFINGDKAKITLNNHIYDREREEKLRIENEEVAQAQRSLREYENKLEEEENGYRVETKSVFDGAGLIVRYDYFREKRWKYRFNKERSLKGKDIVETIELNEGKHGFELPYTDEMTIDEAVERFLNDREQVKKALALWNIDLDKIKEEDIIEKINEVTFNY